MKKGKNIPVDQFSGSKFEAYVGTLYQNLGYRVSYNVNLSGQQVDLLVEKTFPGYGQSKIAVECKYQRSGNIGNQKVYDFISVSETLIRNDGITKSVMVTNTGYTDMGWAAANKNQFIELMTIRSLEDELFDLAATYRSFVDTYETKEIFSQYVALNGGYNDGRKGEKQVSDIEKFLIGWLKESHDRLMTIFGDFGSGKSTMLNRLKYIFAKAYIQGESTLKPFLINLKDFYKYDTVDKLIAFSAIREFEREVSIQLIYRQIETGQIILLLDGFDEMGQQIDTDIRVRNFLLLSPVLRNRTILTCRPSYFIKREEYNEYSEHINQRSALNQVVESGSYKRKNMEERELMNKISAFLSQEYVKPNSLQALHALDFETIDIAALSALSIDEYLENNDENFKRVLGFNWEFVKKFLISIYDISDLMTRPMLLEMIVKTLLSGSLDLRANKTNVGPAGLYELYTSTYLDIDFEKGDSRQLFTTGQRRILAISNALLMFRSGASEISYTALLEHIASEKALRKELGDIQHLTFEQVVADVQITTFLIEGGADKFRFAHKSFMEFFVARYLYKQIIDNQLVPEFLQYLPKEVLYFLGSFCTILPEIEHRLVKWFDQYATKPGKELLVRNIVGTRLYAGAVVSDLNWEGVELSGIEFKRRSLRNIQFNKINILNVNFIKATLYNCKWESAYLRQVDISDSEIHGTFWSVIAENLKLTEVAIHNCNFGLSGKGIFLQDSKINDSSLAFAGGIAVSGCSISDTTINWDATLPGDINFDHCVFYKGKFIWPVNGKAASYHFVGCSFTLQKIELIDNGLPSRIFDHCDFNNCFIYGLRLDLKMVKTCKFLECDGYVLLEERAVDPVLNPYKQSGSISYFKKDQLYYIPESTWNGCQRDLKKFKEKIRTKK